MSDHIDFELNGNRRLRLTMEGDVLIPEDVHPLALEFLLQPLAPIQRAGKAEFGYRFAEVDLEAPGSLEAMRTVLHHKLPQIGLEGRTEPPLPPEDEVQRSGDAEQDVTFDA